MERRGAAVHDEALAARVADRDLGPGHRAAIGVRRQHQFRAPLLMKFDREHPAQTRSAAALEHDVPAGLQLQAVQRGLEREPAPVHRGGEREHRRFHFAPRFAEAVQLPAVP